MKIYLAGPMSSVQDFNFPEFFRVTDELRSLGHQVINPAETNGPTVEEALNDLPYNPMEWEDYMRIDLQSLTDSEVLCLLPGWQASRGARLEVKVAKELGMPIYVFQDGELKPRLQVIGISGYARSGKDTIAEHLISKGYIRGSFADAIREALLRLDPVVNGNRVSTLVEQLGWEAAKSDPEIRALLQRLGTEVGREMFGDNIWIDHLFDSLPDGSKVVISDVRYPNEAEAIEAIGGQVWRVNRPGISAVNAHISDSALDEYTFPVVLSNSGSIDDLHYAVDSILGDNPDYDDLTPDWTEEIDEVV